MADLVTRTAAKTGVVYPGAMCRRCLSSAQMKVALFPFHSAIIDEKKPVMPCKCVITNNDRTCPVDHDLRVVEDGAPVERPWTSSQ